VVSTGGKIGDSETWTSGHRKPLELFFSHIDPSVERALQQTRKRIYFRNALDGNVLGIITKGYGNLYGSQTSRVEREGKGREG